MRSETGGGGERRRRAVLSESLVAVVVGVTAAALAWGRLTPTQRGTMWAEDAAVFSRRALESGETPFGVLTGYAGYTHLLPQTIADLLWRVVPAEGMAVAFTTAACAVAGAVASGVFLLTRRWGLPLFGRIALASVTVLSPGSSVEVIGNLANLHWLLLYLAPFLFMFRPRTWPGSAVLGAVVLVVVTTEVQALLFSPLLAVRPRDRRLIPAATAVLGGIAIQAAAFVLTRQPRATDPRDVGAIVRTYFFEVPLIGVSGSSGAAAEIVLRSGALAAVVSIVPFAVATVLAARASRRRALIVAVLALSSAVLWAGGFGLNYSAGFDFLALPPATLREEVRTLRYAVVPIMMLWACVVLAAARLPRPGAVAVLALCLTAFVVGYRVEDGSDRAEGPLWSTSWVTSRTQCESDPQNPSDYVEAAPEGWGVEVGCAVLIRR